LSVEPKETNVELSGAIQEDHERFSVDPRKHEDGGIQDVFETIQVEMKEKGGEKDTKDGKECLFGEEEIRKHDFKGGEKCLIGDPEVWMEDENAVYLCHKKKRHSIVKRKGRESQGERKDEPKKGELENKHVPMIVREAVSRFKEKAEKKSEHGKGGRQSKSFWSWKRGEMRAESTEPKESKQKGRQSNQRKERCL